MIDLFYPQRPFYFRRGRVVSPLTPAEELTPTERRKGEDKERARIRQARYRAKLQADPVRHAKHLEGCRAWHQAHREEAIQRMRERHDAIRDALRAGKPSKPAKPRQPRPKADPLPGCDGCGVMPRAQHFSWCTN